MHLFLTWFSVSLLLVMTALLNYRNDVWNRTPFPRMLGTVLHDLEEARKHAAFSATLLALPQAPSIPVPVVGVDTEDIVDTYGEPRGSDRSHEGTDIFARRGTYVRSATEGIVVRMGENRLGGNIVFILGPGGERYYYAHLDRIDSELALGTRVSTTTLLGTVGTTGNATGTPPHLHFGIYGQGGARNPYERISQ